MREEKLSEDQSKKEELFTFFLKTEGEKEGEKKEKSNVLPDTTREWVEQHYQAAGNSSKTQMC